MTFHFHAQPLSPHHHLPSVMARRASLDGTIISAARKRIGAQAATLVAGGGVATAATSA